MRGCGRSERSLIVVVVITDWLLTRDYLRVCSTLSKEFHSEATSWLLLIIILSGRVKKENLFLLKMENVSRVDHASHVAAAFETSLGASLSCDLPCRLS